MIYCFGILSGEVDEKKIRDSLLSLWIKYPGQDRKVFSHGNRVKYKKKKYYWRKKER